MNDEREATFLQRIVQLEYFVVICCGIRRSIRYTANGHPEENPIGAAKETLEVAYDTRCANFRNNNGIDIIALANIYMMLQFELLLLEVATGRSTHPSREGRRQFWKARSRTFAFSSRYRSSFSST
ncbi:hypothetical protein ANCCEY_08445 [Ancylostoma ceylanicum]|uniref:Uncharacterized protein n=1 Tax=Ancylostoma ceylanicum TaxID=53326 RepID=A0A0D6LXW1_9BILA|nr:hypothetical protein ANCCEY_08445 [Ancylostoma ceylanicum]